MDAKEGLENLIDALGIEDFTLQKDFGRERGWNPSPTEAQIRAIDKLCQKLQRRASSKVQKSQKKDAGEAEEEVNFDLKSRTRVVLFEGKVFKKSVNAMIQHSSKRYAILLNDVLLITSQEGGSDWGLMSGGDKLTLHQVLPLDEMGLLDLRLVDADEDPCAFEIITRDRSYVLSAESESDKSIWLEELEAAIFSIKAPISPKKIGWQLEIGRGTIWSSAAYGDVDMLRRRMQDKAVEVIDETDETGMNPLHWAAAFGQTEAAEVLLDAGCDVDSLNGGLNSALLIAAAMGHAEIVYLLVNRGADVYLRNLKDFDCMYMAVLFGGFSGDLHDEIALMKRKGLDVNQRDASGATPLHACANRSVARPIQVLVDCGADVNLKHERSGLTPLQISCTCPHPDAETVRSLLEKGAHPNWRDTTRKSAFDMIIGHTKRKSMLQLSGGASSDLQQTVDEVQEFVQVGLPVLMELVKKGCRFSPDAIKALRPSFQEVLNTAKAAWDTLSEPEPFGAYLAASMESLTSTKDKWVGDSASLHCLLCTEKFTYTNRRHHCRACGVLCCDDCSTKRLRMSGGGSGSSSSSSGMKRNNSNLSAASAKSSGASSPSPAGKGGGGDRVCDGCFNRLTFECFQWSLADNKAKKAEAKAAAAAAAEYDQFLQTEKGKLMHGSDGSSGKGGAAGVWAGALAGAAGVLAAGAETRIALEQRGEKLELLAQKSDALNEGAMAFKKATAKILEQQRQRQRYAWL